MTLLTISSFDSERIKTKQIFKNTKMAFRLAALCALLAVSHGNIHETAKTLQNCNYSNCVFINHIDRFFHGTCDWWRGE